MDAQPTLEIVGGDSHEALMLQLMCLGWVKHEMPTFRLTVATWSPRRRKAPETVDLSVRIRGIIAIRWPQPKGEDWEIYGELDYRSEHIEPLSGMAGFIGWYNSRRRKGFLQELPIRGNAGHGFTRLISHTVYRATGGNSWDSWDSL